MLQHILSSWSFYLYNLFISINFVKFIFQHNCLIHIKYNPKWMVLYSILILYYGGDNQYKDTIYKLCSYLGIRARSRIYIRNLFTDWSVCSEVCAVLTYTGCLQSFAGFDFHICIAWNGGKIWWISFDGNLVQFIHRLICFAIFGNIGFELVIRLVLSQRHLDGYINPNECSFK